MSVFFSSDIGTSCSRCGKMQDIPTHQFLKYEGDIHYLCDDCWGVFRKWYNVKQKTSVIR